MKKKLKKTGSDGLMVYFTKEEQEIYGIKEGDPIEIHEDQLNKNKKKK